MEKRPGVCPPEQVVAAEGDRAILIEPTKRGITEDVRVWGKVKIKDVSISTGLYTVDFLFNESNELIQTNVVDNEKSNGGIINSHFDTLSQLLTQKYGTPQFKNEKTMTWKTADTTIELVKLFIPKVIASLYVRYIPNKKVEESSADL